MLPEDLPTGPIFRRGSATRFGDVPPTSARKTPRATRFREPRDPLPARKNTPSLESIYDVAAVLFQNKGFQNITMEEIADELGITKPTLYVHSGSKTAILEGIFERVMREGEEALGRAEDVPVPSERLRTLIIDWTQMATSRSQAHYRVFAAHLPDLPRSSARFFLRWSGEVVERVRKMVVEGQRSGDIRPDIDPTVLAFSVLSVPNWTARWFRPDGKLSSADIAEQQWSLLWAGMATPQGSGAAAKTKSPPKGAS